LAIIIFYFQLVPVPESHEIKSIVVIDLGGGTGIYKVLYRIEKRIKTI
jgi:hypothetical protein